MGIAPGKECQRIPVGQGFPDRLLTGFGIIGQQNGQTLRFGIVKNTGHVLRITILFPTGEQFVPGKGQSRYRQQQHRQHGQQQGYRFFHRGLSFT